MKSMKIIPLVVILVLAVLAVSPKRVNAFIIAFELTGGTLDSPQYITGGPYYEGVGNLGSPNPESYVFEFFWSGGEFSVKVDPSTIYLSLYDTSKNLEAGPTSGSLDILNLTQGDYLFKVATSSSIDPPFTLTFLLGPVSAPTPVPEPSTMLLLGSGLIGVLGLRRYGSIRKMVVD